MLNIKPGVDGRFLERFLVAVSQPNVRHLGMRRTFRRLADRVPVPQLWLTRDFQKKGSGIDPLGDLYQVVHAAPLIRSATCKPPNPRLPSVSISRCLIARLA